MKILHVSKPIIGKETIIKKQFDEMMKELMPVHYWLSKNKKK